MRVACDCVQTNDNQKQREERERSSSTPIAKTRSKNIHYVTGGGAAVTAKAAFDKSKSSNWRTGDQSVNPKKGGNPKPAPPATAAGAASK
jgi:hypothetical protein